MATYFVLFYLYSCFSNQKTYSFFQTHCRRKNHNFPASLSKPTRRTTTATSSQRNAGQIFAESSPLSFINVGGNLIATKFITANSFVANSGSTLTTFDEKSVGGRVPVKIAPKPSPMHLTAAIALSELAGEVNEDQT
jgi:hypothetical protein